MGTLLAEATGLELYTILDTICFLMPHALPQAVPARAAGPVYQRLLDLIIRGRLGPGVRVTEAQAALELGVSRTPVREAMQRLVRDGLLVPANGDHGGRTRLVVASMEVETLVELYQLAGTLEGLAGRQAAVLSIDARASLARRLTAAEQAFRRAAAAKPLDYDRLFQRHAAVHRALVDACAGPELRAALEAIRPRVDRFEWYYAPLVGPDLRVTYREHDAIIRAVRRGSADAIERAMRANWFNGALRLARALTSRRAGTRAAYPAVDETMVAPVRTTGR
jgi:DNA-binding GntR family transcriptional regulator